MGPIRNRPARSPEQFRRWVRLSVATVTSTAMVGGVLVAAPAHPLNPVTSVASAQEAQQLVEDVSYAEGTALDLSLLSGFVSADSLPAFNEALTLIEAEQAWPADEGNPEETSELTLELLQTVSLEIPGLPGLLPLIDDGSGNGLLDLGTEGVGLLGAYASAPDPYNAHGAAGLVSEDGAIDVDPGQGAGNIQTNIQLTALLEQLGLSGLTDGLVDDLSLRLGAVSSSAAKSGDEITAEYAAANAELHLHSPLLDEIGSLLGEGGVGAEIDALVAGLAGDEGLLGAVTGILGGVLNLVGSGIDLSLTTNIEGTLQALLTDPLYDGATPETSLVYIDLSTGAIQINLEQLHGGNLSQLDPNTPLVSGTQIDQIVETVTGLLDGENGLTQRIQNTVSDGLLATEVYLEADVSLLFIDLATLTIDGSLQQLLDEDESVADGGGLLGDLLADVVNILGDLGGDILAALTTPVQGLLGEILGLVSELVVGLDPLLRDVLGNVVQVTVNSQSNALQPTGEDVAGRPNALVGQASDSDGDFDIDALRVQVLGLGTDGGLIDLPIATSRINSAGSPAIAEEGGVAIGLDPQEGPTTGGTEVTMSGENLVFENSAGELIGVTEVNFNGQTLTGEDITLNADGTVTFATPEVDLEETGPVDVYAVTPAGESNTVQFNYVDALVDPAPSYTPVTAPAGEATIAEITYTDDVPEPEGTTYAPEAGYEAPFGWTITVDETTGAVTATVAEAGPDGARAEQLNVPVAITYPEGVATSETLTATFNLDTDGDGIPDAEDEDDDGDGYTDDEELDAGTDPKDPEDTPATNAEIYNPNYEPATVAQDETATIDAPTFTDEDGNTVTLEELAIDGDITFTAGDTSQGWVEVAPDNGAIALTPSSDETDIENFIAVGETTIPVTITYADESTDTVDVPVTINDPLTDSLEPAINGTPIEVPRTGEPTDTEVDVINFNPEESEATATDEDGTTVTVTVDETGNLLVTADENTGDQVTVTITDPDLDTPLTVEVPIIDVDTTADELDPSYQPATIAQDEVAPVDAPTFTNQNDETVEVPEGTTYAAGENAPAWAEIQTDGSITLTPSSDEENVDNFAAVGDHTVPVTITYPDDSTDAVDVTVEVTAAAPSLSGEASTVEPTEEWQDTGLDLNNGGPETAIEAHDEDDQDIPVEVDEEGNITVQPGENVDGPITIIVTDPALDAPIEDDVPVNGHTESEDDNNSDQVRVDGDVNTLDPTNEAQDSGLTLVNASDDTAITLVDEDDQTIDYTVDPDTGLITITPGDNVDGPLTLTVTDPSLGEEPIVIPVPITDHAEDVDDNNSDGVEILGTAGTVDPIDTAQDTGLSIRNRTDEDTLIEAVDEDGLDITVTYGEPIDGVETIQVTPTTNVDGPITLIVTDPTLENSPVEYTIDVTGHTEGEDDNNSDAVAADDYNLTYPDTEVAQNPDTPVTIDPAFTDTDDQPIDIPEQVTGFTLADGTPDWISIDQTTGVITLTPTETTELQDYSAEVTVTYADGSFDTAITPITVTDGIDPILNPVEPITGTVGTEITPVTVTANEDGVTFSDNDTLPEGLSIDPTTGIISGTPAPGTAGEHAVIITGTDAAGNTGTTEITFTIAEASDGLAPTITGDPIEVPRTGEPEDTGMTITGFNPDESEITATDENDAIIPAIVAEDGTIQITADDTTGDTVTVTITDPDLDDDIVFDIPVIDPASIADQTTPTYEDTPAPQDEETIVPAPEFTDEQDNPVTFDETPAFAGTAATPDWATVNPDGTITLTPSSNEADGNFIDTGEHLVPVQITYSDNSTETVDVTVTVTEPLSDGLAPAITGDPTAVERTGEEQDTEVDVSNFTDESDITAEDNLDNTVPVRVDETGNILVTPGTDTGETITVTITDPDLGEDLTFQVLVIDADTTAPVITDIDDQTGTVDEAIDPITIEVTDDSDTEITVTGLPAGLTYNPDTGTIEGTPVPGTSGEHTVTITAVDAAGNDAEPVTFDFTIDPAAEITDDYTLTYPDTEVAQNPDTPVTIDPAFTDTDGQDIETPAEVTGFTLADGTPDWISIDQATGVITLNPDDTVVPEDYPAEVTVTYTNGSTDTAEVPITVTDGIAPVLDPVDPIIGTVGTEIEPVTVTANEDDVTFTTEDLPAGLTIDPATGVISGTPEETFTGPVTITGTDAAGNTGTTEITVTIAEASDGLAPTITGDPIEVPRTGEPEDTGMTITGFNPDESEITATDENDAIIPAIVAEDGTIQITADDTTGDTVTVTITDPDLDNDIVFDVPIIEADTTAPVITDIDSQTGTVDETITPITIEVIDDNDTEVTVTGLPGGLTYNPDTGTIEGTPTTVTGDTPATVTITAVDAAGNNAEPVTFDFTITEAVDVTAPVLTPSGPIAGTVGTEIEPVTVTADEDDVTFTAPDLPTGLTINPDTGIISGTPEETFTGPVTITGTDVAGNTGTTEVTVTIAPADDEEPAPGEDAPSFGGTPTPVNPTDEEQDTGLDVENGTDDTTVTAEDATGNTIPVRVDEDGNIHVTPGTDVEGPITITVTDPELEDPITADVPVTEDDEEPAPGEQLPSIADIANQSATVGMEFGPLEIVVSDPDATVTVTGLPAGLTYNPDTGVVDGIPEEDSENTYEVTVTATNSAGSSTETFGITVSPAEDDEDEYTGPEVDDSTVNPVDPTDDPQDTGIDVTDPSEDTTITAEDEGGNEIPVETDEDGNVIVTPGEDVEGPITVVIDDPALDNPIEVEVPVNPADEDEDPTPGEDAPSFGGTPTPVNPTDEEQDTGLDVENGTDDTTVTAEDAAGNDIPVRVDEDGNIHVTPGTDVEGPITITVTDPELEDPITADVPVTEDDEEPAPGEDDPSIGGNPLPVFPDDQEQDTGLSLEDGTDATEVTARDEDGQDIPVTVDEDGNISVTPGFNVDGPITVIVTDPSLLFPIEVEVPVVGHEEGRDDNNSGDVATDLATGSSGSWITNIFGGLLALLGLGGIWASVMEFMHQNSMLGQAEDQWWRNITNR